MTGSPRRALFVCHDAGGTIPPVLAVAEAMLADGHDVTILSQPSVGGRADGIGARFVPFTSLGDYDRLKPLEDQLDRTLPALVGPEVGDDLVATAETVSADTVVVDPNLTGALAAAETLDARSAVLLHSLHRTYVDVWFGPLWAMLEAPINETRRRFGLGRSESWASLFDGHDAVLAAVPAPFDGSPGAGGQQHHGFLVPAPREPPAIATVDERPSVLVALSTTYQHHEALLTAIVEALGTLPVRALVTTGGHVAVDRPVSPNVTVLDRADHPALMPSIDVVVTHAGLGTIAAALARGVPLVCAPIARDQPLNAERVTAVGAGVVLDHESSPPVIAAAVEQVLADDRYATAARAIAEASRDEGGPSSAASALLAH